MGNGQQASLKGCYPTNIDLSTDAPPLGWSGHFRVASQSNIHVYVVCVRVG